MLRARNLRIMLFLLLEYNRLFLIVQQFQFISNFLNIKEL